MSHTGTRGREGTQVTFVVFVAVVVAIVGLFVVGDGTIFTARERFQIELESANQIRVGAPVFLDGVAVGEVVEIALRSSPKRNQPERNQPASRARVAIAFDVERDAAQRLTADAVAWLAPKGLLGDRVVQLDSGAATAPLLPLRVIPFDDRPMADEWFGTTTRERVFEIADALERTAEHLEKVGGEAEVTLGRVERLLGRVENGTPMIELVLGQADTATLSGLLERTSAATGRLDTLLARLEKGEGSLGQLIHDDTLVNNLNHVFYGVRESWLLRRLIRNAEADGRAIHAAGLPADPVHDRLLDRLRGANADSNANTNANANPGHSNREVNSSAIDALVGSHTR